uniref:hypothetical protein n=1 Tax=Streptomyces murinus TaxID=33900 RepID=UPI001ABFA401
HRCGGGGGGRASIDGRAVIDSVKVEVEVEAGPVTVTFFRASPASPWPSVRHWRRRAPLLPLRHKRRR